MRAEEISSPNLINPAVRKAREAAHDTNSTAMEDVERTDKDFRAWLGAYQDYDIKQTYPILCREVTADGEYITHQSEFTAYHPKTGSMAPSLEIPVEGQNTLQFNPIYNLGNSGFYDLPVYVTVRNPINDREYYPTVPHAISIRRVYDMKFTPANVKKVLSKAAHNCQFVLKTHHGAYSCSKAEWVKDAAELLEERGMTPKVSSEDLRRAFEAAQQKAGSSRHIPDPEFTKTHSSIVPSESPGEKRTDGII